MHVCKSEFIMCSRNGNVGRMDVRRNGKPLEEVDFDPEWPHRQCGALCSEGTGFASRLLHF